MIKEWMSWINIAIASAAGLLLLAAAVLSSHSSHIPVLETAAVKATLPKSSFQQPKEAYEELGEPMLSLKSSPITIQLPDLRHSLVYYGKNNRPDADPNNTMMHFGFVGEKTLTSIHPNEPIYLFYDRKQTPQRYAFSSGNAPTSLWIEVAPEGNQVAVKVAIKNEKGELIQEPAAYAQFTLPEKTFVRTNNTPWEIGKFRVDGTLLARQRARWFGVDRFLERHGGKEYLDFVGKQRIDFGEGDDIYSIFVAPDDVMVWEDNRWKVVEAGSETLGRPILLVKKIDDKLMNFELWDPEGKTKVALNLLKSNEPITPTNLVQNFHFVGARTLKQFVFEINKERIILSPQDWLIMTDKGWEKLVTPEEIDAYVDRKLIGYLFVFDAVERRDDRQIMQGTLFNKSRSDMQHIELAMQQTGTGAASPASIKTDDSGKYKEGRQQDKASKAGF